MGRLDTSKCYQRHLNLGTERETASHLGLQANSENKSNNNSVGSSFTGQWIKNKILAASVDCLWCASAVHWASWSLTI